MGCTQVVHTSIKAKPQSPTYEPHSLTSMQKHVQLLEPIGALARKTVGNVIFPLTGQSQPVSTAEPTAQSHKQKT